MWLELDRVACHMIKSTQWQFEFFFPIKRSHCPLWLIEDVGGVTPHSGGRGLLYLHIFRVSMFTHSPTHPPTSSLTQTSEMNPRSRAFSARPRGLSSTSCRMRGRFLLALKRSPPLTSIHVYPGARWHPSHQCPGVSRGILLKKKDCSGTLPHTQPTTYAPLPQRAQCTRERRGISIFSFNFIKALFTLLSSFHIIISVNGLLTPNDIQHFNNYNVLFRVIRVWITFPWV